MRSLVYLNNFPRENALKGQKFKGTSELEEELLGRNIIGDDGIEVEPEVEPEVEIEKSDKPKKGK